MAKEKKKSKFGSHLASISFFTLMGMVLGFAMISFLEWQLPEGIESSEKSLPNLRHAGVPVSGLVHTYCHP